MRPDAEALLQPIEVAARTFAVAAMAAPAADVSAIEAAVTAFAPTPNGGLIVLPDVSTAQHRDLIIAQAARHRLPAIYPDPSLCLERRATDVLRHRRGRRVPARGWLTSPHPQGREAGRPPGAGTD